jgi:hypothetical protein
VSRRLGRWRRKAGDKIGTEFDHGVVAAYFLRNVDASLRSLSLVTLERFEKVVGATRRKGPRTSPWAF